MLRVLIIDDDIDLLNLLSTHLRQLGHAVYTAASGTEGITAFKRVSPHVTVVDLKMPSMSGMEVLERLREKRAVVVMLTGHADIEDAVRAMQLGAENFLTKPIAMDHLAVAIKRAAEKTVLRQENRDLGARLSRNSKRRMVRTGAWAALVLASVGAGSVIGNVGSGEPEPAPIPVPFRPADTIVVTNDAPDVSGSMRRANLSSPRRHGELHLDRRVFVPLPSTVLPAYRMPSSRFEGYDGKER